MMKITLNIMSSDLSSRKVHEPKPFIGVQGFKCSWGVPMGYEKLFWCTWYPEGQTGIYGDDVLWRWRDRVVVKLRGSVRIRGGKSLVDMVKRPKWELVTSLTKFVDDIEITPQLKVDTSGLWLHLKFYCHHDEHGEKYTLLFHERIAGLSSKGPTTLWNKGPEECDHCSGHINQLHSEKGNIQALKVTNR